MSESVYLAAARRTPVAPVNGAFRHLSVQELAVPVIMQALRDGGLAHQGVDQVILGNALYGGGNPARLVALAAGLPETVPALTVDTQCCSGLDALRLGAQAIANGDADVVVAGGVESTSRRAIRQHRPRHPDEVAIPYERPPFTPWPDRDPDMAGAAARLAHDYGVSLAEQNQWAIHSHQKALAAKADLIAECVPLGGLNTDAAARQLSERLAARTPIIAEWETGQINVAGTALQADAAAVVVLVSESVRRQLPSTVPAVRWTGGIAAAAAADNPPWALVPALQQMFKPGSRQADDFTIVELMEAYAVQALVNARESGLPMASINRGGGALARGHPIGASGAILAVRAFQQLAREGAGHQALLGIAAAGGLASVATLRRD